MIVAGSANILLDTMRFLGMMFRRIKNENGYGLFIVAFLCFDSLQSNEKNLVW